MGEECHGYRSVSGGSPVLRRKKKTFWEISGASWVERLRSWRCPIIKRNPCIEQKPCHFYRVKFSAMLCKWERKECHRWENCLIKIVRLMKERETRVFFVISFSYCFCFSFVTSVLVWLEMSVEVKLFTAGSFRRHKIETHTESCYYCCQFRCNHPHVTHIESTFD